MRLGTPDGGGTTAFVSRCMVFFLILLSTDCASGAPAFLAELDENGVPTVTDLVRLINHIHGNRALSPLTTPYADINKDGVVNQGDADLLLQAILGRYILLPLPPKAVRLDPASARWARTAAKSRSAWTTGIRWSWTSTPTRCAPRRSATWPRTWPPAGPTAWSCTRSRRRTSSPPGARWTWTRSSS